MNKNTSIPVSFNSAIAIIDSVEYKFYHPLDVLVAYSVSDVVPLLEKLERYSSDGKASIGWISYEASSIFDDAYPKRPPLFENLPYACFVVFNRYASSPANYNIDSTKEELCSIQWQPLITKEKYIKKVKVIKENISAGNVYQVNFTFPLLAKLAGDLQNLFRRLCHAQGNGYFVFLDTPPFAVLSISPELFFRYEGNVLSVRPMKGTRPRGRWKEEDDFLRTELKNSEKDRAENLMIVDLLRNDLGKISEFGSVEVPGIFTIEPYRTVWQMTSEVKCTTRASLADVFKSIFPSGSVTGAPKIYAMKLINLLEEYPRGVYCGCAGIVFPERKAVFNVAIRTILYNYLTNEAYYYVGSGIVWDSNPLEEWEECNVKAQIVRQLPEPFSLVETIRVEEKKPYLLDYHLRRLEWSAYRFGFPFSRGEIEKAISKVCQEVNESLYRLRLELLPCGKIKLQYPLQIGSSRVRLGLARDCIDSRNILLYHKTSSREIYNQALSTRTDCEDVLLWNEDGYITESTIANVVVVIDGVHYTPPIECGLLPGTYRQYLIDTGIIKERKIHKDMLSSASRIYLINSVRKEIEVEWVE